ARGYKLAAESDGGMAGTIAYRSPRLWLSFEWDRSNPWLTFTFTDVGPAAVMWTNVDRALNGHAHSQYGPNTHPEAPIPALVAFLEEMLPELEARLESADPAIVNVARELERAERQELAELRAARRFR